jgi:hypothetical protein
VRRPANYKSAHRGGPDVGVTVFVSAPSRRRHWNGRLEKPGRATLVGSQSIVAVLDSWVPVPTLDIVGANTEGP